MNNQGDILDFFRLFKDYIEVLSTNKEREKENLKTLDYLNHLGVESLDEIFSYEEEFNEEFQFVNMAYHLNYFLSDKFSLKKKTAYNYDFTKKEQCTHTKVSVEYDSKKPVKVPYHAYHYLCGDFNLIVEYSYGSHNSDYAGLALHVVEEDEEKLNKLLEEYEIFYKTKNVYKNKKISYRSYEAFRLLPPSSREFKTVILPNGYNEEIEQNILDLFDNVEEYKENGIPLKRGVLLSGDPGTGKTSIIEAICTKLRDNVTIFYVSPTSLSKVSCIENLYKVARILSPSLIVFEDIDLLGGNRANGEFSQLVGELLNQLDGTESNDLVVTVATTNHPDRLDKAISNRPARFDRHLRFHLPDIELRKQILLNYLNKYQLTDLLKNSINSLAHEMKDFSGAQIQEVVISAVLNVMKNKSKKKKIILDKIDIETGINKVKEIFTVNSNFKGFS